MKNSLIIFLALFFCACTSTVYVDLEDKGERIVLNGQLSTFDSHHGVCVSLVSKKGIAAPASALVTYSINGSAAVPMTRDEGWKSNFFYSAYYTAQEEQCARYCFDADLQPGDEILITATVGENTASARVKAPAAPQVTSVDTVTVSVYDKDNDITVKKLQIQVTLKDPAATMDYYRLYAGTDTDVDGRTLRNDREVDMSSEPVLNPEAGSGDSAFAELLSTGNIWGTFTDVSFNGEEYTLKVFADEYTLSNHWYLTWDGPSDTAPADINVHLESISFGQYHYLLAEERGESMNFISEPVSMPSNVEGGIGFVSLATDYHFRLSGFTVKNSRDGEYYDMWDE